MNRAENLGALLFSSVVVSFFTTLSLTSSLRVILHLLFQNKENPTPKAALICQKALGGPVSLGAVLVFSKFFLVMSCPWCGVKKCPEMLQALMPCGAEGVISWGHPK